MQRLAAASDGNHVFVERPSDLAEIFDREFGDALSVSARDITIIIECKLGFKPMRILGRDGSIDGDNDHAEAQPAAGRTTSAMSWSSCRRPKGAAKAPPTSQMCASTYVDLDKGGSPARAEAKPSVRFSANAKEVEDGSTSR